MVSKVNKVRLYWTLQIGGWASYAFVQIIFSMFASDVGVSTQRVLFLLYEAVFCLLLTHMFRGFINRWKWLDAGMPVLIPRIIGSVYLLGLMLYFLRLPVAIPLGLFNRGLAFNTGNILGLTTIYAIIFFMWSVLYFIYNYFARYNTSLKLEASIREIELNNLKSQLNPHFIFNALNSIRALVDENPRKSKEAINQLANILRNYLTTGKRGLTKFEDELKIVMDYLGLESIRFEERLKTQFEIDPESRDFLVPPLMIQTLVENGIKHGIAKLTAGGIIYMKASVKNDRLTIQVRNSGQYLNGSSSSTGLGLENTRQRLKLIYGDKASFRILPESDTFVLTEIEIPHLR